MATAPLSIDSRYFLDFGWYLVSQDIVANTSTVYAWVIVDKGSAGGSWTGNAASRATLSSQFGLVADTGLRGYDFTNVQSIAFITGYYTFTHGADGSLTLTLTGAVTLEALGSASIPLTAALPRIPRGARVKDAGVHKRSNLHVKLGSTWRPAILWVKRDGTWRVAG